MTDPKAIDISPEAVAKYVVNLRAAVGYDYVQDNRTADLLSTLSAARDEVVREINALRSRDATRELLLKEAQANCDGLEEERDASLAELARVKTALKEAREFVADELEVRSASFGSDEPEHADYIVPAERLIATIAAAIRSLPLPPDSRDGGIAELRTEVARLHERLEDNHVFVWDKATDKMLRQEIEPGSSPDGIECRDATIKLQGDDLAKARATISATRSAVAAARGALDAAHEFVDREVNEFDSDGKSDLLAQINSALAALDAAEKGTT